MMFMNENGEIVEGIPVNESKLAALELLKKALANEKYDYLGSRYIESATREEIVKCVAKNFNIELIEKVDLEKAEDAQQSYPSLEKDEVSF